MSLLGNVISTPVYVAVIYWDEVIKTSGGRDPINMGEFWSK